MKKYTSFVFSFRPMIDLSTVSSMRVVFSQGSARKLFDYPSATCTRDTGDPGLIDCIWKGIDTVPFKPGVPIKMDTFIRIRGSDFNPHTKSAEFIMDGTEFRKEEVIEDD